MASKIIVLAGTRPEIIKMFPVFQKLLKIKDLEVFFVSTGQQRELTRQAFEVFGFKPDFDLDVMTKNQSLHSLTAALLLRVSEMLKFLNPSAILVHGDTTTAFAGAVAAFYNKVPIGHVEAGLRTFDLCAPWPEEMNRRLIDPLCEWCFAPTVLSAKNLQQENINSNRIYITGNTVIDALLHNRSVLLARGEDAAVVGRRLGIDEWFVQQYLSSERRSPLILITGHRRESFGLGFDQICRAVLRLVEENPEVGVVYPMHLNPNVQTAVMRILGLHQRIRLVRPVDYHDFILLMERCHFIMTDSGGVQEEAPTLGKPVLVMRTTTERPEGLSAGTSRLVGTDERLIVDEGSLLLRNPAEYKTRSMLRNPYGDGQASDRITEVISKAFG